MKKINLVLILSILVSSPALFALNLAKLQTHFGKGTDGKIIKEINATILSTVKNNSRWTYDTGAITKLGNNKNCFTENCLKKVGALTGDIAGLRIRFYGEAQIYDWSIDIYDLRSGNVLKSKKGACELCGRVEVVRTFAASLGKTLKGAKIKAAPNTIVKPSQKPKSAKNPKKSIKPAKQVVSIKADKKIDKKNALPDPDTYLKEIITTLLIEVTPSDTKIFMNEKEIGKGSTTMEISPGTYNFQFQREGYAGFKETLIVGEANAARVQLRIHLSKTDPDAVHLPTNEGIIDEMEQRELWGWSGVGAGSALFLSGIFLHSLEGTKTCTKGTFQQCPEVYNTGTASIIATTSGAVLITTGIGLLLWETLAGASQSETALIPIMNKKQGGVSLRHQF